MPDSLVRGSYYYLFLALDSFRPHLFLSLQQRRLRPHQLRLTSRSIVIRPPRLASSAFDSSRALNYWKDTSRNRDFTRLAHLSFNLVPTEFLWRWSDVLFSFYAAQHYTLSAFMDCLAFWLCGFLFDRIVGHRQQKNLASETLRNTAREKAANARAGAQGSTTATNTTTATGPKYRDRASERRIMHGQPDVPLPDTSGSSSSTKPKVSGPALPTPKAPTPPPPEPAKDENNIGNKLLKKMGWNAGSGLGASGEGRVDPV